MASELISHKIAAKKKKTFMRMDVFNIHFIPLKKKKKWCMVLGSLKSSRGSQSFLSTLTPESHWEGAGYP